MAYPETVTASGDRNAYVQYHNQGNLNAPKTATERDTIQQALDEQLSGLGDLHRSLSTLEERLQFVLVPPGPSNGKTDAAAPPPLHVLDRLRGSNQILSVAIARVQELTQRLQV